MGIPVAGYEEVFPFLSKTWSDCLPHKKKATSLILRSKHNPVEIVATALQNTVLQMKMYKILLPSVCKYSKKEPDRSDRKRAQQKLLEKARSLKKNHSRARSVATSAARGQSPT